MARRSYPIATGGPTGRHAATGAHLLGPLLDSPGASGREVEVIAAEHQVLVEHVADLIARYTLVAPDECSLID